MGARTWHEFDPDKPVLGTLASCEIVIDRSDASHNHLPQDMDPVVAAQALETVLHQVDAAGRDFLVEEIPYDEKSLLTSLVPTTRRDEIVYAYRQGRTGSTRFVVGREKMPADRLTVVLKRDERHLGVMTLIAAMGGPKAEPEPWDRHLETEQEKQVSQAFWACHALTWAPEIIDFSKTFDTRPRRGYVAKMAAS